MNEAIKRLQNDLEIIRFASTDALKNMPSDRGGRTPDLALNALLYQLILFYEKRTHKKATIIWNPIDSYSGGNFFDFCIVFLKIIGVEVKEHNHESLASRIKNIIKFHKDNHR
jgi:hypothetical protein